MKIRSKKLKQSAKDQDCTFNIVGVCSENTEETVLCHLNILGDKGFGTKSSDLSAAFGCANCHRHIDEYRLSHEDYLWYTRRAIVRTIHHWAKHGYLDKISERCK